MTKWAGKGKGVRGQKGFKGQRGKRGQKGPQELTEKPESSKWSPIVESNAEISRGRVRGTHPEYSVAQTMRYKSQWMRYQKALGLAAVGPFAVVNGLYYWEANKKPRPESTKFAGREDWWPENPPYTRQPTPAEQLQYDPTNYQDPRNPFDDPNTPPDSFDPPGLPKYGSAALDGEFGDTTSLPAIPGGKLSEGYSTSQSGFWVVSVGGRGDWEVIGDNWTEEGDNSFSNSGNKFGSFSITGEASLVPPPPFTGGQCPVLYMVYGTCRAANTDIHPCGQAVNWSGGPIAGGGIRLRTVSDRTFITNNANADVACVIQGSALQNIFVADDCAPRLTNPFALRGSVVITSVVPVDDISDNCGNPPLFYVDP